MASIITDMNRTGEDTTEAENQFAAALDELMELRLDEGSLKFLTYSSWKY